MESFHHSDFSAVDTLMESGIRQRIFPAACVLAGRGEHILYRKAFGHLNPTANAAPCNEQTRFDLASLTKPIVTATLCMMAADEGRIRLRDTLSFFGEVPPDKADITVKQILTHTAGFGSGLKLWQQSDSAGTLIQKILDSKLCYRPGTQYLYTDYGYILLGTILEKIYGMNLVELSREKLFAPLHMEHSGYLPEGGNIASTEQQTDGSYLTGTVHDENARVMGGAAGNAGLFSTMNDLYCYVRMLLAKGRLPEGGRFLSEAAVRLMTENQISACGAARSIGFLLPYGTHEFIGDYFPGETIAHTGFTGTSLALDPGRGIFLILLTNRVCPTRENNRIVRFRALVHNAVYAACAE